MGRLLVVGLALFVIGCGSKAKPVTLPPVTITKVEVVEKAVPTLVHREPPAALLEPLRPKLPVFVSPADPRATSALTPEGERDFLALIEFFFGRDTAWRVWSALKDPP